jgi:hypothetical protein
LERSPGETGSISIKRNSLQKKQFPAEKTTNYKTINLGWQWRGQRQLHNVEDLLLFAIN